MLVGVSLKTFFHQPVVSSSATQDHDPPVHSTVFHMSPQTLHLIANPPPPVAFSSTFGVKLPPHISLWAPVDLWTIQHHVAFLDFLSSQNKKPNKDRQLSLFSISKVYLLAYNMLLSILRLRNAGLLSEISWRVLILWRESSVPKSYTNMWIMTLEYEQYFHLDYAM